MTQLKELFTKEDLEKVWEASTEESILLFKQSTTCPISASAFNQFNNFLETKGEGIEAFFVKVRETREVSNRIAEETGIQHQSPQVLLMKDKQVLWNTSHGQITVDSLERAIKENK